ncbi:hypothetical protein G9F32_15880 [Acinetobacter sp. 194]|uniref:hypothetical protein n=1 Tax=Acinetobacter shaoyimingii TaxID=2715164 RepID=UPI001409FCC2|nr:hypothetical protein [Acinetobacter shaoyimingii]NHB59474.1 hypothetical protein [Acinetobacter shaoyimingii]
MKLLEQISEVLKDAKKEMHVDEIALALVAKYPHIPIAMEQLPQKVSSILSTDIAKNKTKSVFTKPKNKSGGTKRGIYRIKTPRSTIPKEIVIPQQPKVTSSYTGKAGEFAVMSELLFFGFNASYMAVDDGIDIVATKENKYFHIQVKTANLSESNKYVFTLNQKAYDSKDASSTFYILVMRTFTGSAYTNNFLIFPNSEIRRLIDAGVIAKGEKLSFRIEKDRNGKFLLNNTENISWALNRFGIIV